MPDSSTPRRCGICHRPLPAHRHELCARCVANLPSALNDREYGCDP